MSDQTRHVAERLADLLIGPWVDELSETREYLTEELEEFLIAERDNLIAQEN